MFLVEQVGGIARFVRGGTFFGHFTVTGVHVLGSKLIIQGVELFGSAHGQLVAEFLVLLNQDGLVFSFRFHGNGEQRVGDGPAVVTDGNLGVVPGNHVFGEVLLQVVRHVVADHVFDGTGLAGFNGDAPVVLVVVEAELVIPFIVADVPWKTSYSIVNINRSFGWAPVSGSITRSSTSSI